MQRVPTAAGIYLAQFLPPEVPPQRLLVEFKRGATGSLTLSFSPSGDDDVTQATDNRLLLEFDAEMARALIGLTVTVEEAEEEK